MWRRQDIQLLSKERVYCRVIRSILIYDCENWSLEVEECCSCIVTQTKMGNRPIKL